MLLILGKPFVRHIYKSGTYSVFRHAVKSLRQVAVSRNMVICTNRQNTNLLLRVYAEYRRFYSPRKGGGRDDYNSEAFDDYAANDHDIPDRQDMSFKYVDQIRSAKVKDWDQSLLLEADHRKGEIDVDENSIKTVVVSREHIKPLDVINSVLSDDSQQDVEERISKFVEEQWKLNRDILPEDIPVPLVEVTVPKHVINPLKTEVIVEDETMLQKLDNVGISMISLWRADLTKFVLNSNFDTSVRPVLEFLSEVGVPDDELGRVINMFPDILKEPLNNLQVGIVFYCKIAIERLQNFEK